MKKKILIIILLASGAFSLKSQQVFNYDSLSVFRILQTGLETNFNIRMKRHVVDESKGQLTSYKGAFNPKLLLGATGYYGTDPTDSYSNQYIVTGEIIIPTHMGIKVYSGFRLSVETQVQLGVEGYYPTQYLPINESGMYAGISIPLLHDLGRNNSSNVAYLSALMMNKSQNVAFTDEVCQFVKTALTNYYTSYQRSTVFKIQKAADKDAHDYVSDIESMISNEQLPQTEHYRAKAYQLNISQQYSLARNEVVNSLFDLITSVGMKGTLKPNTLPVFLDSLPDPSTFDWDQYLIYVYNNTDSLVSNTPYYKSQELVTSSAEITMNGAKHNRLNDLDLDISYMYFGLTSGDPVADFSHTFSSGSPGATYNFTLSYKLPFKNEERQGDYLTKLSSFELNKTQLEQVKFDARAQVHQLLSDLNNLRQLFVHQVELATIEKQTFLGEVQKFKLGTSTQIDMINTYMDYNSALVNMENGRLAIMTRVIALKYLIGDFPTSTDQLLSYNLWDFRVK